MLSMTGFGKAEVVSGGRRYACELQSVNHRFLDINVRVPSWLYSLEMDIASVIRASVSRGSVKCWINVEEVKPQGAEYDVELAKMYRRKLKELAEAVSAPVDIPLELILSQPGVVVEQSEVVDEKVKQNVLRVVKSALRELVRTRRKEGEAIKSVLREEIKGIADLLRAVKKRAKSNAKEKRRQLMEKLHLLVNNPNVDEVRLHQELFYYLERIDIVEECARLSSHIKHFRELLRGAGGGRKMVFLVQEMLREANTIASKSNCAEVSWLVVQMKEKIEIIRENVQNVE